MDNCPCNGCELRYSHCHVYCKLYKDWVIYKDAQKELMRKKKLLANLLTLPQARVSKRNK